MIMPQTPRFIHFHAVIFAGGTDDLLRLNLGFINCKFYKVNSEQFKRRLKKISKTEEQLKINQGLFDEYKEHLGKYFDTAYVVLPKVFHQPFNDQTSSAYIRAGLLVMFPADFGIVGVVPFVFQLKLNGYAGGFGIREKYKVNGIRWHSPKFLTFGSSSISSVNRFMRKYVNVTMPSSYLDVAIQSYYNSFFQDEMRLCYLTLFISLESLAGASTEITYQISRMCAVLNSSNKEEGRTLFTKVKKLYGLRSEIAHGTKVKGEIISRAYFHLQMLASRTLVEVISHDFKKLESLKTAVDEHGYGEKVKLSSKYDNFKIIPDDIGLLHGVLPKLK